MPSTTETVFFICKSIITVTNLSANGFVIFDICKNGKYRRSESYIFVFHLAIADILAGLNFIPSTMLFIKYESSDFSTCLNICMLVLGMANTAIIMLLCVTGDRFFAIVFPFHYLRMVDTTTANFAVFVVWNICLVFGFTPYFWKNEELEDNYNMTCTFNAVISYEYLFLFNFLVVFGVPFIIILCIYLYINKIVKRVKKADQVRSQSCGTSSRSTQSKSMPNQSLISRVRKSPFAMILVIVVLLLPMHILNALHYFEMLALPFDSGMWVIATILHDLNAVVNPFVYSSIRKIRLETRLTSKYTSYSSPYSVFRKRIGRKKEDGKLKVHLKFLNIAFVLFVLIGKFSSNL